MSDAERLAKLEVRSDEADRRLASVHSRIDKLEVKIDRLLEMANLGKGSIWLLLKAAAFIAAIGAAFAWAWERFN